MFKDTSSINTYTIKNPPPYKNFFYKVYKEIPIVLLNLLGKQDLFDKLIKDKRFIEYYKKTFN